MRRELIETCIVEIPKKCQVRKTCLFKLVTNDIGIKQPMFLFYMIVGHCPIWEKMIVSIMKYKKLIITNPRACDLDGILIRGADKDVFYIWFANRRK